MTQPTIHRVESRTERSTYDMRASEPVTFIVTLWLIGAGCGGAAGLIFELRLPLLWATVLIFGAIAGGVTAALVLPRHYRLKARQRRVYETVDEYLVKAGNTAHMAATVSGVTAMHTLSGVYIPTPEGGYFYVSPERVRDIASVVSALHGQLVEARLRHFNTNSYAELSRVMLAHDPPLMERAGNNVTMLTRAGYEAFGMVHEGEGE